MRPPWFLHGLTCLADIYADDFHVYKCIHSLNNTVSYYYIYYIPNKLIIPSSYLTCTCNCRNKYFLTIGILIRNVNCVDPITALSIVLLIDIKSQVRLIAIEKNLDVKELSE